MDTDLIKYKTTNNKYQEKLNKFRKQTPSSIPMLYVGMDDDKCLKYDIILKPDIIIDFIRDDTIFSNYFLEYQCFSISDLNPFKIPPEVLKVIQNISDDTTAFFILLKCTPFRISTIAFEMLMDVIEKRFKQKIRQYINVLEKINFKLDYKKVNDYFILTINVDPDRRNCVYKNI